MNIFCKRFDKIQSALGSLLCCSFIRNDNHLLIGSLSLNVLFERKHHYWIFYNTIKNSIPLFEIGSGDRLIASSAYSNTTELFTTTKDTGFISLIQI